MDELSRRPQNWYATPSRELRLVLSRMGRAIRLESLVYREVVRDERSLQMAVAVILIAGLATAAGDRFMGVGLGFGLSIIAVLIDWIVFAYLAHLLADAFFHGGGSYRETLAVIGFAYSPAVFKMFAALPSIGPAVPWLATAWMLLAVTIALRAIRGLGWGQAAATVITASAIPLIVGIGVSKFLAFG